jgi:hypothetical protein
VRNTSSCVCPVIAANATINTVNIVLISLIAVSISKNV